MGVRQEIICAVDASQRQPPHVEIVAAFIARGHLGEWIDLRRDGPQREPAKMEDRTSTGEDILLRVGLTGPGRIGTGITSLPGVGPSWMANRVYLHQGVDGCWGCSIL